MMSRNNNDPEHFKKLFEENQLFMDKELFDRFRQLKDEEKEIIAEIDQSISDVQEQFSFLRDRLQEFSPERQQLLSVLITRSIKRALREILIQDTDFPEYH